MEKTVHNRIQFVEATALLALMTLLAVAVSVAVPHLAALLWLAVVLIALATVPRLARKPQRP
jgi:hypothetical protein